MSDTPKLYVFFPALGLPDPSPFPLKVAAFMRLHDIAFETISGDVRKAPLGKIPYLEHNGKTIPDSELILDYLEQEFDIRKDDLTAEQHAAGHMICRTLEEYTYWAVVYSRWIEDDNWAIIREQFFASVPALMRGFIANKVRKDMVRTLHGQGIGRHSSEQIYAFAQNDLQALSDLLGTKDYLFGDTPTRYDCTALAFVAEATEAIGLPIVLPKLPNLSAYWQRGKERFFSESL